MSNFDVMLRRTDASPDEKRLVLEGASFQDEILAAVRKWNQMGAMLVKDAARQPRQTLQYKPGTANQPGATQPFNPYGTVDVNSDNAPMAPGAYIVTLTCETSGVRYTTSGRQPTPTFGMLVKAGTFVDITLQDIGNLQLCATASGEIIDLEYFQVDA